MEATSSPPNFLCLQIFAQLIRCNFLAMLFLPYHRKSLLILSMMLMTVLGILYRFILYCPNITSLPVIEIPESFHLFNDEWNFLTSGSQKWHFLRESPIFASRYWISQLSTLHLRNEARRFYELFYCPDYTVSFCENLFLVRMRFQTSSWSSWFPL